MVPTSIIFSAFPSNFVFYTVVAFWFLYPNRFWKDEKIASQSWTLTLMLLVLQFFRNATLIKIGNESNPQQVTWTKFYYDWPASRGGASRFDFYLGYLPLNLAWKPNFSILFVNFSIYHIYPNEQKCEIRSCSLPSINPKWLQSTQYQGTYMFKGIPADLFTFGPELDYIQYWQRHADKTPMRSTNQANDPGATDYIDVAYGEQDPSLWKIPAFCPLC